PDSKNKTRLLFTSREVLPVPYDQSNHYQELGRLSEREAIKLVEQVLRDEGIELPKNDKTRTHEEVAALVQVVDYHARALTLIARQLGGTGIEGATQRIGQIMQSIDAAHPGEREKSLFASVQFSLNRLSPEMQEQAKALAVFHGGGHIVAIAEVAQIEGAKAQKLAGSLIEKGLATDSGKGHIRLDPALSLYMDTQLTQTQRDKYFIRWKKAIKELCTILYEQLFNDVRIASYVTRLEVGNLLAMLENQEGDLVQYLKLFSKTEELLLPLDLKIPNEKLIQIHRKIGKSISSSGRAKYLFEISSVDRAFLKGDWLNALILAKKLIEEFKHMDYPELNYDFALTRLKTGRIYHRLGNYDKGLFFLQKARETFDVLAKSGNSNAERMVINCFTEEANCFADQGSLEQAERIFKKSIEASTKMNDIKGEAISKGELAGLFIMMGKFEMALSLLKEVIELFHIIKDNKSIATAWHQLGKVYVGLEEMSKAEEAYQAAMRINVQRNNYSEQALTLGQLGQLYQARERYSDAIICYQRSADLFQKLGNLNAEGAQRNHLAELFMEIRKYENVRFEVQRAIKCFESFDLSHRPWISFGILYLLEVEEGNLQEAKAAWLKARNIYLEYRQYGGIDITLSYKSTIMLLKPLIAGEGNELLSDFNELHVNQNLPYYEIILVKLKTILQGSRETSLADDMSLPYNAAADILWLLEQLDESKNK
ncbi:MAG: tetratricopeptide repeat protein, partial [Bacteroidia bacterium]